ncbi:unnamed protein product [Brassica rapa subsp. trilocularis]
MKTCSFFFFCRMVLKATGYKSVPINGLPSDHKKCESQLFVRLMSIEKRSYFKSSFTGLYLCGWLKRGPVAMKLGGLGKKILLHVGSICETLKVFGRAKKQEAKD